MDPWYIIHNSLSLSLSRSFSLSFYIQTCFRKRRLRLFISGMEAWDWWCYLSPLCFCYSHSQWGLFWLPQLSYSLPSHLPWWPWSSTYIIPALWTLAPKYLSDSRWATWVMKCSKAPFIVLWGMIIWAPPDECPDFDCLAEEVIHICFFCLC